MFAFFIVLQRNRKLILRSALLVLVGAGAIALALPSADAGRATMVPPDLTALLTPEPVSSAEFSTLYAPRQGRAALAG